MWREAQATILYEDDRDMGTCSNALRITWFGQRHLTSTLTNYRAANGSAGAEVGSHPGSYNMGYVKFRGNSTFG